MKLPPKYASDLFCKIIEFNVIYECLVYKKSNLVSIWMCYKSDFGCQSVHAFETNTLTLNILPPIFSRLSISRSLPVAHHSMCACTCAKSYLNAGFIFYIPASV